MNDLHMIFLIVGTVLVFCLSLLAVFFTRQPSPAQKRAMLLRDAEAKLIDAECAKENATANVALLQARLARLRSEVDSASIAAPRPVSAPRQAVPSPFVQPEAS